MVHELEQRLRKDLEQRGDFERTHVMPASGADVPDEMDARLVVLGSDQTYSKAGSSPAELAAKAVLESRGNTGTTWRYYAESADDSDIALQIATGTVDFDTRGQLATTEPISVAIDRTNSGADTPLAISIRLRDGQDNVTALADTSSAVAATSRDGVPIGTLTSFGVGADGTITGSFSNGMTRTLGRVALANFTNDGGLVDAGPNLFRVGPNSGSPVVTGPGNLGAGRIAGGSLELSNVDIAEEFINLIVAQTGYSASSRVIQTTNDLFQQLLVLAR